MAVVKKIFPTKYILPLKEASETIYWLDLLFETKYINESEYNSLKNDCEELRRILSATTKTLKNT